MGLVDHLLGRRIESFTVHSARAGRRCQDPTMLAEAFAGRTIEEVAVSYTHLTLPTNREV